MKPIAAFAMIAAFSLGLAAAGARNASAPQSDSERVANTVAGPGPDAGTRDRNAAIAQPGKKALKKSRIRRKPPLHDPD